MTVWKHSAVLIETLWNVKTEEIVVEETPVEY